MTTMGSAQWWRGRVRGWKWNIALGVFWAICTAMVGLLVSQRSALVAVVIVIAAIVGGTVLVRSALDGLRFAQGCLREREAWLGVELRTQSAPAVTDSDFRVQAGEQEKNR